MPTVKFSDNAKPVPYIGLDLDKDGEIDTVGVVLVDAKGNPVPCYPEIRRFSSEISGGLPTVNDDGSDLIKYQTLIVMDTDASYVWDGSSWVVL